jgi:hypothetical protein
LAFGCGWSLRASLNALGAQLDFDTLLTRFREALAEIGCPTGAALVGGGQLHALDWPAVIVDA